MLHAGMPLTAAHYAGPTADPNHYHGALRVLAPQVPPQMPQQMPQQHLMQQPPPQTLPPQPHQMIYLAPSNAGGGGGMMAMVPVAMTMPMSMPPMPMMYGAPPPTAPPVAPLQPPPHSFPMASYMEAPAVDALKALKGKAVWKSHAGTGRGVLVPAPMKTRWVIDASDVELLEQMFDHNPFSGRQVRQELALRLQVRPRQVQVWFQNKRQKLRSQGKVIPHDFTIRSEQDSKPASTQGDHPASPGEEEGQASASKAVDVAVAAAAAATVAAEAAKAAAAAAMAEMTATVAAETAKVAAAAAMAEMTSAC